MTQTTYEINAKRRERYNAKKSNTNIDENKKSNTNIDENKKSNTNIDENINNIEEPPEADLFENLYNYNYEFSTINPMKVEKSKNTNISIELPITENKENPKNRRKTKPIEERTKQLFERIQNRTINIDDDIKPINIKQNKKQIQNSDIDSNTELKDKLLLSHKIKQYKILFPTELKGYKVSEKATVQKLKSHLDEIEILISLSSVDTFIMDSIFYCIKIVEGISTRTKNYNIEGLADILKSNPEFIKLSKQLYLKYNTFECVPPEYQIIMIVATSSYICMQKNKNKNSMNDLLNQPYISDDDDDDEDESCKKRKYKS